VNFGRNFPFGIRQLGAVGHGKSHAAVQAQAVGGGSTRVILDDSGGPHSVVVEADYEEICTFGQTAPTQFLRSARAKCGCGWSGTWATMPEAQQAAREHYMGMVERHLEDVPFTPREVEDAKVVNGTIEYLLAD
jgi:hypothetical protein